VLFALHKEFNSVGLVLSPHLDAVFHTETIFLLQSPEVLHPVSRFSPQTPDSNFPAAAAVVTLKYANTNKYLCFILFRYPNHRKYFIRICGEIHEQRCEINCPVIILYSVGDNAFRVLM
jgi:hypothetical protein